MTPFQSLQSKIQTWEEAARTVGQWKEAGARIVFTNGCFDILHFGHVRYLAEARHLGDRLVIGLNSAASVRRLKGPNRPIHDELTRTYLLAGLGFVDLVVTFEQDTPVELITLLMPDVLVKGGDRRPEQIAGADIVLASGGQVLSLPFVEGYSTTLVERKIKSSM